MTTARVHAPGQPLPRARFQWAWLVDSPLLIAAWVAVVMGLLTLVQVARALREADRVRERSNQVFARMAAEAAVAGLPASAVSPVQVAIGRVAVRVESAADEWLLTVVLPDGERCQFRCANLPGEAPAVFGRPLSLGDAAAVERWGGCEWQPGDAPELDPQALAQAWPADRLPAFRRDVGIALIHCEAGTERDDYVVDSGSPDLGLPAEASLVSVPGHLWIPPGNEPWRLYVGRDLTVVVQGNLYVGRPIEVDGPGRLLFVTAPVAGAVPFVDGDGNGRWSPGEATCDGRPFLGAVEGAGNAYLGMSAASTSIEIGAGLVVGGQLHLRADSRVDGPVALAHGVTQIGGRNAHLLATGARLFAPGQERVPGFLVSGPARHGRLRSWSANHADAEEPLYLAAPGR